MASVITPTWTDNVSVLAMGTVARNTVSRTVIDLRTKWGAMVFVRIGRGGTTALTVGVGVRFRRLINAAAIEHVGGAIAAFVGQVAAAVNPTCAAAGNNLGTTNLVVSATTSIVAGDIIFIDGTGGTGNSEWCMVAQNIDATHLLLDAPTQYAHNNVADHVRQKSDLYTIWLEGGSEYEMLIDYGASTTGEAIGVEVLAQTFDSIAAT